MTFDAKLPIQIFILVNKVGDIYFPVLRIKINEEDFPDALECKIGYSSREQALKEASRLIEAIFMENPELKNLIIVEIVEENRAFSEYNSDGVLLH